MPATIAKPRKPQATIVQRRVMRIQSPSVSPESSAPIAKANGTDMPDVAQVEERRMHRHERMVLQQRIRSRSVGGHGEHRMERVRRAHEQDQEEVAIPNSVAAA